MEENKIEIKQDIIDNLINNICIVRDNIKLHTSTILVGENGTGKSVVRKQLGFVITKKTKNKEAKVRSVSMETRTGTDCCGMHLLADATWEPTSSHTNYLIRSMFKSCLEDKDYKNKKVIPYYFVIDEPEVGMSRESQLALSNYLKEMIPIINKKCYGILIITHSELIVNQLKDICEFMDLNNPNRTADEWINREIVPTDFEYMDAVGHELFNALLPKNK